MYGNSILIIVLIVGTICVVFQRQFTDILFRYCALGKLLDKLGTFFSSKQEQETARLEVYFQNAEPKELQAEWRAVLAAYAGKYNDAAQIPKTPFQGLPDDLKEFFAEYDFLRIDGSDILDKKALKSISIGKTDYIVIGEDLQENSLFVIRADGKKAAQIQVFIVDSNLSCSENLTVNTCPEKGYKSIRNFACFMALYYGNTAVFSKADKH